MPRDLGPPVVPPVLAADCPPDLRVGPLCLAQPGQPGPGRFDRGRRHRDSRWRGRRLPVAFQRANKAQLVSLAAELLMPGDDPAQPEDVRPGQPLRNPAAVVEIAGQLGDQGPQPAIQRADLAVHRGDPGTQRLVDGGRATGRRRRFLERFRLTGTQFLQAAGSVKAFDEPLVVFGAAGGWHRHLVHRAGQQPRADDVCEVVDGHRHR